MKKADRKPAAMHRRGSAPSKLPASDVAAPVKASLELALLGLIAATPRISGYDIVRIFNLSMRHFWHAHQGQIYPTLARMERGGWIASRDVIQRGRPNKRLFSISSAGREALARWLSSPFEEMKIKHAPLLKTLYLGHLGADRALQKFAEQRAASVAYLEELCGIEREFFREGGYRDEHRMFAHFTLRYGIGWMEENIRWCDWAMGEIEKHRALFSTASSSAPAGDQRKAARR